jgi:hypothetical protein
VIQGYGRFICVNGIYYEGEFNNGYFDGKGKYVFESGKFYEGEFKNGKFHGWGILSDNNGLILKQGNWT